MLVDNDDKETGVAAARACEREEVRSIHRQDRRLELLRGCPDLRIDDSWPESDDVVAGQAQAVQQLPAPKVLIHA